MITKKIFTIIFLGVFILTGCDDMFEPAIENNIEQEFMYKDAFFASGLLLNAYSLLPSNGWRQSDAATDNAVSNNPGNNYRRLADGQWTSDFNPFNEWQNSYHAIQYLNLIINGADKVKWTLDDNASFIFSHRFKGEAHGLRAIFMLNLLQHHAGIGPDGQLLGVPIITEVHKTTSNFNIPRSTFQQCINFIYHDLDTADALLPIDYDMPASQDTLFLSKYKPWAISNVNYVYNPQLDSASNAIAKAKAETDAVNIIASAFERAFDYNGHGRISKRISEAIRSRATLLAASEAYAFGNSTTWADAAKAAAKVLSRNDGVNKIDANGTSIWFSNSTANLGVDKLPASKNPDEVLWRTSKGESNNLERDNFPPTKGGNGRMNPTQNFVDAFPMTNGYPIDHASSNYNPQNPYLNRDPRLALYVVLNNSTIGLPAGTINTTVNGPDNNALNRIETSTRTGYYLRKLLRTDVNLIVSPATSKNHYRPHIRFTEMFLNYAEAANEAYGPTTAAPGVTFTAYDVIRRIRARAVPARLNNDPYLTSIMNDKDEMRKLIRNERRLELCFEDFRFWDLRRWKANLNENLKGMRIEGTTYSVFDIGPMNFASYMYYGPIPKSEILKFNALDQNQGW